MIVAAPLLIEIGCEEIPARFCHDLITQLEQKTKQVFKDHGLFLSNDPVVTVYGTARRFAIYSDKVRLKQADTMISQRGPAVRAGEKAVAGFAKKWQVAPEALVSKTYDGQPYYFIEKTESGKSAEACLPDLITTIFTDLSLPIVMRWGEGAHAFIRPVHWVCVLLGKTCIPMTLFGIQADRYTYGHRFLSKGVFGPIETNGARLTVSSPDAYLKILEDHYVVVDQNARKATIEAQLSRNIGRSKSKGDDSKLDPSLIEIVTYLAEWPEVLGGHMDTLGLPELVVSTCIKTHQKAFALADRFVFVADSVTPDNRATIIRGNERVVQARLNDAAFFYKQDQKKSLEAYLEALKNITFQANVGSLYDKTQRIITVAAAIADQLRLDSTQRETIETVARLCKCDLATQMVKEFPVLQGVIGQLYTHDQAVSLGIFEHYLPRFADDTVPTQITSVVVGIADRIDTLLCCFYNGLVPTGSKDPWALRRLMNGLSQILSKHSLSINIKTLMEKADTYLKMQLGDTVTLDSERFDAALAFIRQRQEMLIIGDCDHPMAHEAYTEAYKQSWDLYGVQQRALAVARFHSESSDKFNGIKEAAIRVYRITKGRSSQATRNGGSLNQYEKRLSESIQAWPKAYPYLAAFDHHFFDDTFADYLKGLATELCLFFDHVMVMDEDEAVRENRLALLVEVRDKLFDIVNWNALG